MRLFKKENSRIGCLAMFLERTREVFTDLFSISSLSSRAFTYMSFYINLHHCGCDNLDYIIYHYLSTILIILFWRQLIKGCKIFLILSLIDIKSYKFSNFIFTVFWLIDIHHTKAVLIERWLCYGIRKQTRMKLRDTSRDSDSYFT